MNVPFMFAINNLFTLGQNKRKPNTLTRVASVKASTCNKDKRLKGKRQNRTDAGMRHC
jgi:hypothetical protein